MRTVYFDHAATTPVDKRVLEAMKPWFTENFGNANSAHQLGNNAKVAVEDARETIAEVIGAAPAEIIFTSGGTESDNAVIKGALAATGKKEIITSPLEHHAVLHAAESQKRNGCKPVYLEPGPDGTITAEQVEEAITDQTALVSLMHVNNEIGTVNPLKEISEVCRNHGVLFHSDTVQSIGKLPVDIDELGLDFLSMSGHKIYGPKGTGVMYVRHGSAWMPWMHGGSQERRRRGGTLNVAGIIGMTKALELCTDRMDNHLSHFSRLRQRLLDGLQEKYSGRYRINGSPDDGVPHIINLAFTDANDQGIDGEMLLLNLDMEGICVSNGSACTSGAIEPSHVLTGLGLPDHIANSSIRISLGKDNDTDDIDYFLEKLEIVLKRMMATA